MARQPGQSTLALPGLEDAGLSPIRRQYLELKRRVPDAVLFFRLGDFYETFQEDAQHVARVLDITLTSREMGRGERLPMAGIPAHAADGYVARLLQQGVHVAIAEQVGEVPRTGLVRREIVRVLTPGTVMEDGLLGGSGNNFLAALVREGEGFGLAYLDVTTGEFHATEVRGPTAREAAAAELVRVGPAECLLVSGDDATAALLPEGTYATERGADLFAPQAALRTLGRRYGGAPEVTGVLEAPLAVRAAGALLAYVGEARPAALETLSFPRLFAAGGAMLLDRATRRNLDLLESATGGPSLVRVLDRTCTAMGGRLLRAWLGQPLLDCARIDERLNGVQALVDDTAWRTRLGEAIRGLPDLERLAVRAGQQILLPRECLALATALERVPAVAHVLGSHDLPELLERADAELDTVEGAAEAVRALLRDDATVFGPGVVRDGVSEELDQQRSLAGDARQWIVDLEKRERERSGVRTARVGFNKVFGYFLEVSQAVCAQPADYYQRQATGMETVGEHLDRLGWQRKQTLANAERFITPELKDLEARIARASDEALRLERELFNQLLAHLASVSSRIAATARALALLDVLLGLAETAVVNRYVRPVVDEGETIEIRDGRHPVVESVLPAGQFVANDVSLDPEQRMILLTGPNMAGKSTYLRQVALLVLLAQVGSFVPARSARVGVVDRVFTRIGAHDDLAAGRSTFMVEMIEAATILRSATARSLVILDEVGRGTSTYDGIAMAQAIVEDLHDPTRRGGSPKTIFATHYHELTRLADTLPAVRNYRVDVLEKGDAVVFLHAVVEGGADRSFGVHVARLAGVPERVTRRAATLLRGLEDGGRAGPCQHDHPEAGAAASRAQDDPVRSALLGIDVLGLTPLQAHAELARLQDLAREG